MPHNPLSFLIDECLHASLVEIANGMGYVAHHIEHLGLKGASDWRLWKRALQDNLIFVTINAQDFGKFSHRAEVHPGVILILPMASPQLQRQLFRAGLGYLAGRTNLINCIIEIDLQGDQIDIREIELP